MAGKLRAFFTELSKALSQKSGKPYETMREWEYGPFAPLVTIVMFALAIGLWNNRERVFPIVLFIVAAVMAYQDVRRWRRGRKPQP